VNLNRSARDHWRLPIVLSSRRYVIS